MNPRHYASTPDGQLCFILALKVCEGVQDIADNIYTSRLPPQDHCLNGPLGDPEVGREGTMEWRQPPAYVCSYCMCANYSMTEEPDRPSLFGRRHAQMLHIGLTSTDWAKMRPWSDSSVGLGPKRKIYCRSHGSGERGVLVGRQGRGSGRINITFICLKTDRSMTSNI